MIAVIVAIHPSDVGRMVMIMSPTKLDLPSYLKPATVIVYVRTIPEDGDDTVYGAYATVTINGVRQVPLMRFANAMTFSQGCLVALIMALRTTAKTINAPVIVYIPDKITMRMVWGRAEAKTPVVTRLVEEARRLLAEKLPNASIRFGMFYDLIDDLPMGDDLWD